MPIDPSTLFPAKSLFKFVSLSEGQSPTWQQRIDQLLAGEAYLSSPVQFNDPFDCLPHVAVPKTREDLRNKQAQLVARFIEAMPDQDPLQIGTMIDALFSHAALDMDVLSGVFAESFAKTSGSNGVFCLAEAIESVLMWSHYASNHTGVALRFDMIKQPRGGLMPLFKVNYSNVRPAYPGFFEDDNSPERVVDALRTKAQFWEYEREWRFIEPSGARTYAKFDPKIITGIVLGARCTEANAEWLDLRSRQHGVPLMRAEPDPITFELRFFGKT